MMAMSERWIETVVPTCPCPFCGHRLDCASGTGTPKPGDLTICIECASPLRFADDLTVRAMSRDEIRALHPKEQAGLRRYMAAVRAIDRRRQ